ncbi:MAG: hypothetical protein ABDK94_06950 [Atribacterota bacterium]
MASTECVVVINPFYVVIWVKRFTMMALKSVLLPEGLNRSGIWEILSEPDFFVDFNLDQIVKTMTAS